MSWVAEWMAGGFPADAIHDLDTREWASLAADHYTLRLDAVSLSTDRRAATADWWYEAKWCAADAIEREITDILVDEAGGEYE